MTPRDRARLAALVLISLVAEVLIGRLDASASWDDTAVTAGPLVISAGVASFVGRRLPRLFAVTTGMSVPLSDLPRLAGRGALAALPVSSIGAALGWLAARQ